MNAGQRLFLVFLLLCGLLLEASAARAQDTALPIEIGELARGTVTALDPAQQFLLATNSPQRLQIEVIGLSEDFVPAFRVLDATGSPIQSATGASGQAILEATSTFPTVGLYTIEVRNATGLEGEFVLTLQRVEAPAVSVPLTLGEEIAGSVSPQVSLQVYAFNAIPQVLLLNMTTDLPTFGPLVTLIDAVTGETVALNSARLIGVRYRIPGGTASYRLEVMHSGSPAVEPYRLCLETEDGTVPCGAPALEPTAAIVPAEPPVETPCLVSTNGGINVNVRSGPGTEYSILTGLSGTQTAMVIGRSFDNFWWQINLNGTVGWVSAAYVTTQGNCGSIPAASAPPPPPASTLPPAATDVPPPPTPAPTEEVPVEEPAEEIPADTSEEPAEEDTAELPLVDVFLEAIRFGPDLTVSAISVPGVVTLGHPIIVTAVVQNIGNFEAAATEVRIAMGPQSMTVPVGSIPAGSTLPATGTLIAAAVGPQSIQVTVDAGGALNELEEGNNGRVATVIVLPPSL